jgi:hypothetical protein
LDRRALGSATFNTLNEALYALDFEDLDTLANENEHDFLLQMVRGIRETIAVDLFKIINTVVSEYNDHVTGKKSTRLKVDGESEIMRGIKIYEGFLGEKGLDLFGIRYAARELCASKEPNVQQFVGALEMESVRGQSRLLTSIVEERERLEVSNAARYAIQTVLAPSLVRNGDADKMSKKENIVLLHDTISKLGSAKTKSAFNACLLNFIHNYQNTGIGVQSAPSSIRLAAALLFPSHQENEN